MERIIKGLGRPALIEEFIQGDEFDVCILGNYGENQRVLPQTRYIFSGMKEGIWPVFTYSAKWENDPDYQASIISQSPPRRVNKKLLTFISEIALDTYNIVDCHDYGRSEFRVDKNGNPYLIEINTNPLLHGESAFVDAVSLLGMDQGDLIEEIISMAINRYKTKPPYYHLQGNEI